MNKWSLNREVGTATYKLLTPEESLRIRQATETLGWRLQLTGMGSWLEAVPVEG